MKDLYNQALEICDDFIKRCKTLQCSCGTLDYMLRELEPLGLEETNMLSISEKQRNNLNSVGFGLLLADYRVALQTRLDKL